MDKQERAHKRLEEFTGSSALRIYWLVSLVVGIGLSLWLSRAAADFVPEFLEWAMAFARIMLPMLVAITAAGVIAAALRGRLGPNMALFVFFLLIFVIGFGAIELTSPVPASDSVAAKQAEIDNYWRALRGRPSS